MNSWKMGGTYPQCVNFRGPPVPESCSQPVHQLAGERISDDIVDCAQVPVAAGAAQG